VSAISVVRSAPAVLRPPPTPTRHDTHFPAKTGYKARLSGDNIAGHRGGEGLPSSRRHYLYIPHPIRRRVLGGCDFRFFTASMAFAVISAARLPLLPPSQAGPLTTLQVSLHAADHTVAPPKGLLTLGFDPDRFQPEPPVCYRAS